MARKKIAGNSFKSDKLSKTKARRSALDSERRIASLGEARRRNDLMPTLEVRQLEISKLKPSRHRTRITTAEQLERVTQSIAKLGFNLPILIRGNEIIDGHVRAEAALHLGLVRVATLDCSHLSDSEVRELSLAVNRIGELGEWDLDRLRIEFEELIELGVDLDVTGFGSEDQDIILLDPDPQPGVADEELEPPAVPVTRTGDIWQCGEHRVICGDSREQATFEALLGGEQAHCVLSDPPYNVPIKGNVSGLGKKVHDEFVMASGEMDDEQWQTFLDTVVALMAAFVVPNSVLFLFMDWRSIHRLYEAGFASGLKLINLAVWYKQSGGMGALYRSSHELVAVFCKGDKPHTNNVELGRHGRDRQNVWSAPGANRRGSSANEMLGAHATPKPVEICVDAILDVTSGGQIVLDAFLGSGTTLIAAEQSSRRCYGAEYEPRFVDVTVERWMRLTGLHAELISSGETFAQVKERRLREVEADAAEG